MMLNPVDLKSQTLDTASTINLRRSKSSKTDKRKTLSRHSKKRREKKKLWSMFDTEIKPKDISCIYSKNTSSQTTHSDALEPSEQTILNNQFSDYMCTDCKSPLRWNDQHFMVCSNDKCGKIVKDVLDGTAEWRYYGSEDNNSSDPTRCGMPINPLLRESSFGCKILVRSNSSYEMRKIKRFTEWQSMPYKEKSQYDEFQIIRRHGRANGISKFILDDALKYHKKISEHKTFRGCNRSGIIAASVYISCKVNCYPRTPKEIATIFNLDNGDATKGCKNAVQILNELETGVEGDKTYLHQTTPQAFIQRYCSQLNMNEELTKLCSFIACRIEEYKRMPENTPHSVAGGIVYFISQVCNLNITKRDVHNISQISEVTINKCYKKLLKNQNKYIPRKIVEKYNSY